MSPLPDSVWVEDVGRSGVGERAARAGRTVCAGVLLLLPGCELTELLC